MVGIGQFSKLAPYLNNGFVLAGFCLLILVGIVHGLVKARLLAKFSQKQSFEIVKYAYLAAIISIVGGFFYGVILHENDGRNATKQGTITQQTGSCGSNIAGNGNKSDVTCEDKTAGAKAK